MNKRVRNFILKLFSSFNALFLLFQPFAALPTLVTDPAIVHAESERQEVSPEAVQIEFLDDSHEFHITAESDEELSFSLQYDDVSFEEPVTQAVEGTMREGDQEGVVEASVYAGTCSTDGCVATPFENGILRVADNHEVNFEKSDEYGIVQEKDGRVTYSYIEEGVHYGLEGHDDFGVVFSELPEDKDGSLVVRAVELDEDTVEATGALSSVAYEIISNLADGEYKYDLELPRPEGSSKMAVKYAESEWGLIDSPETIELLESSEDLMVRDLDHMTVFVVTFEYPDVPSDPDHDVVWFDSDDSGNGQITRVASGHDGITSFEGDWHALFEGDADSGPFTRFDGYRDTWTGEWIAEASIYLDPSWDSGTGFDYSVAANGSDGNHQRDYIFHVTKDTSTGDLMVAGSNNTNFAPREDLENINHYVVGDNAWFTLQHRFYNDGGSLSVDLNLIDSSDTIVWTETRSNVADTIPAEVGGNRYGWFTFINVDGGIAVDDTLIKTDMDEEPEPEYLCDGWACLEGDHKDFMTTGRYGGSGWTNGINNPDLDGDVAEVHDGTDKDPWTNKTPEYFRVSYDPDTGLVRYTKGVGDGAETWEYTYDSGKAYTDILFFAKGDNKGNHLNFTDLVLNGVYLGNFGSGEGYKGLKIPLSDEDQIDGFVAEGYAELYWSDKPEDEIPAFHVFALNTHDLEKPVSYQCGETIYSVNNDTDFSQLNPATGVLSNVDSLVFGSSASADDPINNRTYYIDRYGSELAYYDHDLETHTTVGSTGIKSSPFTKLAFNPNGVLYGLTDAHHLYMIDTANGASSDLGVITGIGTGGDITFDEAGTLYLIDTNGKLFTVSLLTKTATLVSNTRLKPVTGMAYLAADGMLYVSVATNDNSSSDLYKMNTDGSDLEKINEESQTLVNDLSSCVFSEEPVPFCGDGEVNQDGEQCDYGELNGQSTCSSQCTWINECREVMAANGSFEIPVVTNAKDWDAFDDSEVPGWSAEWFGGYTPYQGHDRPEPKIELHLNKMGPASDGRQYLELDSDWGGPDDNYSNEPASIALYQDIPTIPGNEYTVTWSYSPRPKYSGNHLQVKVGGSEVFNSGVVAGGSNIDWQEESYTFIATSSLTRVSFVELGTPDSFGMFLDDVRVECNGVPSYEVTMCKQDEEGQPLAGWTLGLSKDIGISQLISVDGSGDEIPVDPADYVVYTSGTYRYGNSAMIADAGWSYRPSGIPYGNDNWVSGDDLGVWLGALELKVEGQNLSWGAFNPAHTYSAFFPGFTDSSLSLSIYDNNYADNLNNGAFTATVEEVVAYGLTNERGCVVLEDVEQGDYNAFEVPQEDWLYTQTAVGEVISTSYPSPVSVDEETPRVVLTNEFRGTGTVEGYKFEDVNASGKDDDEPRLEGWIINLYNEGWEEVASAQTDSDGEYSFDQVPSGATYYVCEEPQEGWTQTASSTDVVQHPNTDEICIPVEVAPGETSTAFFGNFEEGFVQGRKYPDSNMSGVPDAEQDEPWIDGWTIRLYKNLNGWVKQGDDVVTGHTGNTGQYRFDGLMPGDYAVCEVAQDGWEQTGPVLGANTVDRDGNLISDQVTAIENPTGINEEGETCWSFSISESGQAFGWVQFGNFEYGVIQGRKYLDANTNGIPDDEATEPYLNDWQVRLYGLPEGEETEWTQMATAITGDTSPADISGYVDVPPNVDGQFRFHNLEAGSYAVCEVKQDGWYQSGPVLGSNPVARGGADVGLDSVAIANESPNSSEEGSTCWQVDIDQSGEVYGYTMFGNYEQGSIDGYKYYDENQNGEFDEEEKTLEGWGLTIRNENGREASVQTDEEGYYNFNTLPAGTYEVCEEDRTDEGWEQTEPEEENGKVLGDAIVAVQRVVEETPTPTPSASPDPEEQEEESKLRCHTIVIDESGERNRANFGNWIESSLYIEKFNDAWPNDQTPGGEVTYTIRVMAVGGPVFGAQVFDLPPENFEYVPGSYTSDSSDGTDLRDEGTTTEPTYASPGEWILGDLAKDEIITLTYRAQSDSSTDPGVYPDMVWATGTSAQSQAQEGEEADLLAISDPEFIAESNGVSFDGSEGHFGEENFAGTQVAMVVDQTPEDSYDVEKTEEREGSVLGASTELPATGAHAWINILALLSTVAGAILLVLGKRKQLIKIGGKTLVLLLVAGASLYLARPAQAVTSVRVEEPYNNSAEYNSDATTNQTNMRVDFVVLNTENLSVDAQCQQRANGGSWSNIDTFYTVKAGGNSGYCEAKNLTNDNYYDFRVVVSGDGADIYSDDEPRVNLDTDRPGKPRNYSKSAPTDCKYEIKFKTDNDGQTSSVQVYRSSDPTLFKADAGSRIATISIGPDQEYTYTTDRPACGEEYYYVIRAFDDNGNGSDLVGDEDITVVYTDSTTGGTQEVSLGAIPVGESYVGGSILGDSDGAGAADGTTDEDAMAEDGSDESAEGEDGMTGDEDGAILGADTEQLWSLLSRYALPVGLGAAVIVVIYLLFFRKKK